MTALLPDELVREVQEYTGGETITESLNLALGEWVRLAKLRRLNEKLNRRPLQFRTDFTAAQVRALNRKVT